MSTIPVVDLGKTGLRVSKLGFGTFDFGVPSFNISPEQGGRILFESYKLGVNFWDTSDDYGSHPHVSSALRYLPRREVVISTKTSAKSGEEAEKSLQASLKELCTDYIDIFLLHYVRSSWIDGCHQVLRELVDEKSAGVIRAIGLSTHSVTVARKASQFEELDVLMTVCCKADQTILNRFRERIPLEDGSIEEMFRAIELAHSNGKGIIAMKVLGNSAPPLIKNYRSSIRSVVQLGFVDTLVIGMKSLDEVRKNIKAVASD